MQLRSRGLLVDGVDEHLYVPRRALEAALLDPMLSGGNVLLTGPGGAGKTTSMRMLKHQLDQRNVPAVLLNASLADGTVQLLELIAAAFGLPLEPQKPSLPGAALRPALEALERLRRAPPGGCVLLDGLLQPETGLELFGRLRDEVWELDLRWALASRETLATTLRKPPADAFWDRVVRMPPLADNEVDELLDRGLRADERADLLRDDGWSVPNDRWPRSVVRAVRDYFEGTTLQAPEQLDVLRQKEAELERVPSMVLAELQQLRRPAAAGDFELLDRLGFSRAYVARALAELEQRGLVIATPQSTEGRQGRPQKLYEPTIEHA